jgi:putative hemolysin
MTEETSADWSIYVGTPAPVACFCFDRAGGLYLATRDSRVLYCANPGGDPSGIGADGGIEWEELGVVEGSPTSICPIYQADPNGPEDTESKVAFVLVTDDVQNSLIRLPAPGGDAEPAEVFVADFEGCPLAGPCALAQSADERFVYFVDRGPAGATGLASRNASAFAVHLTQGVLRPLLPHCLADPSSCDATPGGLFVAESAMNRIILLSSAAGSDVHHASVWAQLSGGAGISAICSANGCIVACCMGHGDVPGTVTLLSPLGEVLGRVAMPRGDVASVAMCPRTGLIVIGSPRLSGLFATSFEFDE